MEDSKYIASYVSESGEDNLQPVKKTKRLKKRAHKWIKESVFKSKEEAVSTVLNEGDGAIITQIKHVMEANNISDATNPSIMVNSVMLEYICISVLTLM